MCMISRALRPIYDLFIYTFGALADFMLKEFSASQLFGDVEKTENINKVFWMRKNMSRIHPLKKEGEGLKVLLVRKYRKDNSFHRLIARRKKFIFR